MMTTSLLLPSPSCASILSRGTHRISGSASFHRLKYRVKGFRVQALREKTEEIENPSQASSPEEVTKKYGLEAGLWKIFSSKEEGKDNSEEQKSKADQAKELLAKYGGAYLATSITLSLISFALCYALISAGIDVQSLLQKIGISADETGEKVGTFALAYAAHKAASPIRFPPTVALTPIVAGWIGKKVEKDK
ncbi:uncharacterized protein LOC114169501 [Vigna unguiculata]|uniref:DUF1279 domain-containing protein n=1 Tax=Vigna unguiculata TaxID=3917 RepID=A0A4D6LI18_VIGUN|nr:uncharacterized protein LOC114169501 [Vigna unguiculata]QCD88006.1 hypothetical protein DEO72_LG3g2546 [Vigna unguiculata]